MIVMIGRFLVNKIAVIYLGRMGGGPVYAYEMTRGLIENGNDVSVFISKRVENLSSWMSLKSSSLELIDTFSSAKSYLINTLKFRKEQYRVLKTKYEAQAFDACYIPMGSFWDDMFVDICGNPQLIVTIHDPIWHSSDRNFLEYLKIYLPKLLLVGIKHKRPDDIIVLSRAFREVTSQKKRIDIEHVHVIPHGVFDFYKTVDSGKTYSYAVGKTNFLFLGRICGYKGIDILAEAYKMLKDKYKDISLTIVGSGDFSLYCDLYDRQDDVDVINKWIPDDEMASYFKSKERIILILPYKDGTQSGVISTAMSFGVPIIATNTGGLSEQIEDRVTGYLCEPNNPEDLFRCMEEVMLTDTREIEKNEIKHVHTLDWTNLSRKLGEIIDHEVVNV